MSRNKARTIWSITVIFLIVSLVLPIATSFAQDQRELEAEKIKSNKLKGEHPLVELMRSRVHADDRFEKKDANRLLVNATGVSLLIELSEPKELKTALEANALTAPGPPGSVDKGERQERGQKLSVSTTMPTNAVHFVMHLRIEK